MKWLPVVGYEGLYEVSNMGDVRSLPRRWRGGATAGRTLKPGKRSEGYVLVALCKSGVMKTFDVHILVARAFFPEYDKRMYVDHINENRSDNRLSNLRMATFSQNMHASTTGWGGRNNRGVHWFKRAKLWQVYINVDGRRHNLGYFKKKADALAERLSAEKRLMGKFARGAA